MNIQSFKASLREHPELNVRFVFPDGDAIEPEFHVTEVGHVVKNFIDCGGTTRSVETCLLQTWVGEDDPQHRLTTGRLAQIMEISAKVLPPRDLEIEVEYQGCAVSQYKLGAPRVVGEELQFTLLQKETNCLAREACGVGADAGEGCGCGNTSGKCC